MSDVSEVMLEGSQLSRFRHASTPSYKKFNNCVTQVKSSLSLDTDSDSNDTGTSMKSITLERSILTLSPVYTPLTDSPNDENSVSNDTGISMKSITLERSIQTLSPIHTPLTDTFDDENSVSIDSLPLMNNIPEKANIATPELSLNSDNSEISTQEMHNLLHNAGYAPSVIEKVLPGISKEVEDKTYGRSRPRTLVFRQGKTFTYEKLEVANETATQKRQVMASRDKQIERTEILNPSADPFVPRGPDSNTTTPHVNTELNRDAITSLQSIRIDNLKNVIIGQLNINSLRNKFHALVEIMHGNLDVLVITETKLDHTFPENQFLIPGYKKPYRKDRNKNGGGVMVYVREDIPSDILLKHKIQENIEAIFVEINLRKNKLLLVGTYHSTHEKYGVSDQIFFQQIGLALDVYSAYDKFLLAGDFNVKEEDDTLEEFMEDYHAKNLVKEPTCFKNPDNPSCIDLFITNSYRSFQKTTTLSTGLSDFHKMTITVLKTTFPKAKPRIITYRTPCETVDLEIALKENLEKMDGKK